jgi:6-phosphogluconolactonase (cycloisomerase 2 family)
MRDLIKVIASAVVAAGCGASAGGGVDPSGQQADKPVAGNVFAMTNAAEGNEIVMYQRATDGSLSLVGKFATGGKGSGGKSHVADPDDALGSQGSLRLSDDGQLLFVANAGSNEIVVQAVAPKGLTIVNKVDSGGLFPASLTQSSNHLYVLNAGGGKVGSPGPGANITGFSVAPDGSLSKLDGSTRTLDVGNCDRCGENPPLFLVSPAQVGFNPAGNALVITIKGTDKIHVFPVNAGGLPSAAPVTTASHGSTPFGFIFDRSGRLIVSEPFGNSQRPPNNAPNAGAVSSYQLAADGSLSVISKSIDDHQATPCWMATGGNRTFAYTTNNASSSISGYAVGDDGSLTLLDGSATDAKTRPVDLGMTADGRFLYSVNAGAGTVSAFAVGDDGSLKSIGDVDGLPIGDGAMGIAVR